MVFLSSFATRQGCHNSIITQPRGPASPNSRCPLGGKLQFSEKHSLILLTRGLILQVKSDWFNHFATQAPRTIFICSFASQGPVVQSWVSTNNGLKFNPMFQLLCFYIPVHFKTVQTKTIDQDTIS